MPSYLSPKQACGAPVTPASDVFSLGRELENVALSLRRQVSGSGE